MPLIPATLPAMNRELLRRRAISFVLVAIIHFLGFLLLLSLAPETVKKLRPS